MAWWLSLIVGLLGVFVVLLGIYAFAIFVPYGLMVYRFFRGEDPFQDWREK